MDLMAVGLILAPLLWAHQAREEENHEMGDS
jgi:hypothetical protein